MALKEPTMIEEQCESCGEWFLRIPGRRRHHCHTCKMQRALEAAKSQSDKRGPIYEEAARRQYRYWRSELKRLGVRP